MGLRRCSWYNVDALVRIHCSPEAEVAVSEPENPEVLGRLSVVVVYVFRLGQRQTFANFSPKFGGETVVSIKFSSNFERNLGGKSTK